MYMNKFQVMSNFSCNQFYFKGLELIINFDTSHYVDKILISAALPRQENYDKKYPSRIIPVGLGCDLHKICA